VCRTRCIFWILIIFGGLILHILRDQNGQAAGQTIAAKLKANEMEIGNGDGDVENGDGKMPWSELFRLVCLHNWIGLLQLQPALN